MKNSILSFCLGGLIGIILLVVLHNVYLNMGRQARYNRLFACGKFDRQVWIADAKSHNRDSPRGKMAEDIIRNHLHKGLTKQQVVTLLGEPEETDNGTLYPNAQKNSTHNIYYLGQWSGFRVDYDCLHVVFDEDGKLTEAWIIQH
ncbi:MAG: hypothetical protein ACYC7E_16570 [Armatimonadota bacterium]